MNRHTYDLLHELHDEVPHQLMREFTVLASVAAAIFLLYGAIYRSLF